MVLYKWLGTRRFVLPTPLSDAGTMTLDAKRFAALLRGSDTLGVRRSFYQRADRHRSTARRGPAPMPRKNALNDAHHLAPLAVAARPCARHAMVDELAGILGCLQQLFDAPPLRVEGLEPVLAQLGTGIQQHVVGWTR